MPSISEFDTLDFSVQATREEFLAEFNSDVDVKTIQETYFTPDKITGHTGLELLMTKIKNTALSETYTEAQQQVFIQSIREKIINPVFNTLSEKALGMHQFLQIMHQSELTDMGIEIVTEKLQTLTDDKKLTSLLQLDQTQMTLLQRMLHYIKANNQPTLLNTLWETVLQPLENSSEDTSVFFNKLWKTIDLSILERLMQHSSTFRAFALRKREVSIENYKTTISSHFEQHFSSKIDASLDSEAWANILIQIIQENQGNPTSLEVVIANFLKTHSNLIQTEWEKKKEGGQDWKHITLYKQQMQSIDTAVDNLLNQLFIKNKTAFATILHLSFEQKNIIQKRFVSDPFLSSGLLFKKLSKLLNSANNEDDILSPEARSQLMEIQSQLVNTMLHIFSKAGNAARHYDSYGKIHYNQKENSELSFMGNVYPSLSKEQKIAVLSYFNDVLSSHYNDAKPRLYKCFETPEFSWAMAAALCEIKASEAPLINLEYFKNLRKTFIFEKQKRIYTQFAHDLEFIDSRYSSVSGSIGELLNGDPSAGYFSRTNTRGRLQKITTPKLDASQLPSINQRDADSKLLDITTLTLKTAGTNMSMATAEPEQDALSKAQTNKTLYNQQYHNSNDNNAAQTSSSSSAHFIATTGTNPNLPVMQQPTAPMGDNSNSYTGEAVRAVPVTSMSTGPHAVFVLAEARLVPPAYSTVITATVIPSDAQTNNSNNLTGHGSPVLLGVHRNNVFNELPPVPQNTILPLVYSPIQTENSNAASRSNANNRQPAMAK